MKSVWSSFGLLVAVTALAACSQVGGGSTIPQGRDPQTLRAIPIVTPSPTTAPR